MTFKDGLQGWLGRGVDKAKSRRRRVVLSPFAAWMPGNWKQILAGLARLSGHYCRGGRHARTNNVLGQTTANVLGQTTATKAGINACCTVHM